MAGVVVTAGVGDAGVVEHDVSGGVGVVCVDGVCAANPRWRAGYVAGPVDRVDAVDGAVGSVADVAGVGHIQDEHRPEQFKEQLFS